tara:strand:+ start:54 stop:941 length:888 start_codon:yes stop_codon:yes gene_type:complete
MASTYTDNSGIELIGVGEQSGTWGTTTNNNLEIIDKALNGVTDVAVSGNMNIAVSDGDKTSNGHTRVLKLTGSLSSEATLTITPDDREAFYIVHNTAGDAVRFKQISGNTGIVVPNNSKAFIYADGKGSGSANVFDLLDGFAFGGTKVTSTATELNIVDGGTSATSTTVADADRVILNDDGTMVQAAVTDISTYMNANAFLVPSAITSTSTLTPSAAKSIYQKVDTSSGDVTVTLAIGSLAIGQYIILDKTSSSNTMTVAYPSNSQGLSLGNSASFVIAINQDGSVFTFVETLKF